MDGRRLLPRFEPGTLAVAVAVSVITGRKVDPCTCTWISRVVRYAYGHNGIYGIWHAQVINKLMHGTREEAPFERESRGRTC